MNDRTIAEFTITMLDGETYAGKAQFIEIEQKIAHPGMETRFRIYLAGQGDIAPEPPCGNACAHVEPYGFVPEAGCPIHDAGA